MLLDDHWVEWHRLVGALEEAASRPGCWYLQILHLGILDLGLLNLVGGTRGGHLQNHFETGKKSEIHFVNNIRWISESKKNLVFWNKLVCKNINPKVIQT